MKQGTIQKQSKKKKGDLSVPPIHGRSPGFCDAKIQKFFKLKKHVAHIK